MSRLISWIIAAYVLFATEWGLALSLLLILTIHWQYFSGIAGELAEDYVTSRTVRRLRADHHAAANPYFVLLAMEKKGGD